MDYNFKKLSEVEKIEEVPDAATVYVEVEGETKRVAKNKVGGTGAVFVDLSVPASQPK